MNRKAQGLSINTIIIAAIALIVLVVLVAIFTGRLGIFSSELTKKSEGLTCAEQGGDWLGVECSGDSIELFGAKDQKDNLGKNCCARK